MTRVICVTGTDTEVGKTVVTEALAVGLRANGLSVIAIKPVESGTAGPARPSREDGVRLAEATGQAAPRAALTRLEAPLAPPVAAALQGMTLSPDAWVSTITALIKGHDVALIEGAGGLMSPLTASHTLIDIAQALDAEVLVVVRDKLGCLNHTGLTLSALDRAHLTVCGVVMNQPEPQSADTSTAHNLSSLTSAYPALPIVPLGWAETPEDGALQLASLRKKLRPSPQSPQSPQAPQSPQSARSLRAPQSPPIEPETKTRGVQTTGEVPPSLTPWVTRTEAQLSALRAEGLFRERAVIQPLRGLKVEVDGEQLTLFSSNDYLGLSSHPTVRTAAADAASRLGTGPRGSALICGHTAEHAALEAELARLADTESALLCPTGFAANLVVCEALAGPDVAIFSDALNHASIIEGTRLARRRGAKVIVYPHGDVEALARALEAHPAHAKLIITDGVFSMDGDLAPLKALAMLKAQHDALLVVDEAHATGVFGPRGAGVAEALGVSASVDLHIGTLSKSLGSQGGFIAGSEALIRLLENRGRAQIYSTALPISTIAAARAALSVLRDEPELRVRLNAHIERVNAALGADQSAPIFAHILKTPEATMAGARHLRQRGLHVTGIRPPTVPEGTSRLRITLSAGHTDADITALLDGLSSLNAAMANAP